MTRYAQFCVDFTDGEQMDDVQFSEDGHPATIEITDLWVIIRTDITETWTPRERIASVSVGTDSATPAPAPTTPCGDVCGTDTGNPCVRHHGHNGKHIDQDGGGWD